MKEGMFYVLCFKEDDEKRWFLSQIQVGNGNVRNGFEVQEINSVSRKGQSRCFRLGANFAGCRRRGAKFYFKKKGKSFTAKGVRITVSCVFCLFACKVARKQHFQTGQNIQ